MTHTYIKEVKIQNFKTYRNTKIRFHEGLNIVIGPNGSGKSNLIEAILFGLGERSPKTFRAYNFSDLIPHTLKNKRDASISVTLIICDSNNNEHVFRRKIDTKDGRHHYYYNGKAVSRTTYITKLSSLGGEGLHYVYIPQGKIISHADASPKTLRKIIDEALGIEVYEEKKKEALKQLEIAENKLATLIEKEKILKEIIYKLLHEMVNRDKLENLDVLKRRVEGAYYSIMLNKLRPKKQRIRDKIYKFRSQEKKLINIIDIVEEKLQKLDSAIQGLRRKIEEEGLNKFTSLINQKSSLEKELNDINLKIEVLERDLGKIKNELERENQSLKYFKNRVKDKTDDIRELLKLNKRYEKELKLLEKNKRELEEKEEELRTEIRDLRINIETLSKKKNRLIESEVDFLAELKAIKKVKSLYIEKKKEYANRVKRFEVLLREIKDKINNLKDSLEKLSNDISILRNERDKINKKIERISREISDARKLERRMEKIIDEVKRSGDLNIVLVRSDAEYIYKVAKDLNLKGIKGILADRVSGPRRILSLLEKYAGDEWYSIIVDDEEAAKKIFELSLELKKQVTIKPLSKYVNINIDIPEKSIVHTLIYPKYLDKLIKKMFGGIIIVNNLDNVFEILAKGYGVIHVNGEYMITPSEWRYKGKRIRVIISEELNKLIEVYRTFKKMIKIREEDLEKIRRKRDEIIMEIRDKEGEKTKVEELLRLLKENTRFISDILRFYKDRIRKIEEEMKQKLGDKKLDREIKKSEEKLGELESLYNKKLEELNIIQIEINELNKKIIDLKSILTTNNKQILIIKDAIKDLNREKDLIIGKIGELKNQQDKILMEIKEYKLKKKEYAKKIAELERIIENYNEKYTSLKNKENKLHKKRTNLNTKWRKYNEKLNRLRTIITSLEYKERDLSKKINELEDSLIRIGYNQYVSLDNYSIDEIKNILKDLEEETNKVKEYEYYPAPNSRIDYKNKYEPYKNFTQNKMKLVEERNKILEFIERIDREKETTFIEGFNRIKEKLRKLMKKIFPDIDIEMNLEDPENIDSGILIYLNFRDGRRSPITSEAGGIKSLFILLYLISVYSLPGNVIYLLDEADAHIDPRNLQSFSHALKELKKENQFIFITLPREEALPKTADYIINIFFRNGISRPVVLSTHLLEKIRGR